MSTDIIPRFHVVLIQFITVIIVKYNLSCDQILLINIIMHCSEMLKF